MDVDGAQTAVDLAGSVCCVCVCVIVTEESIGARALLERGYPWLNEDVWLKCMIAACGLLYMCWWCCLVQSLNTRVTLFE